MGNFDFKKQLRKQILIREGWEEEDARQKREDNPNRMVGEWGLTSEINSDSLKSLLDKYQKGPGREKFTDGHKKEIVNIIRTLAKKKGVVLEEQEVSLIGLRSERDRHLPAQDVLNFLNKIGLARDQQVEVAKIIDEWGRLNLIKFTTRNGEDSATDGDEGEEGDTTADADEKEKYKMSLASLGTILQDMIEKDFGSKPVISPKVWARKIKMAIKKDIPDMRLDEARDPVAFVNTLDMLTSLGSEYKKAGLNFKPVKRAVYDFLKVNNLEASAAFSELFASSGAAPEEAPEEEEEEEEDWERSETEEVSKLAAGDEEEEEEEEEGATLKDSEFCSGILDLLKTSSPSLYNSMEDDNTIRGAVANIANDISLTSDAVLIAALSMSIAFPPLLGAAGVAKGVGVSSSVIAVAMDLMLGNVGNAAIDAIGIPFGKGVGVVAKVGVKNSAKVAARSSSKVVKKLAQITARGAKVTAKAVALDVEQELAKIILKKAKGQMTEASAEAAAKIIKVTLESHIQTSLKKLAAGSPDPKKFKNHQEYKLELQNWQKESEAALESEYQKCFRSRNSGVKNNVLKFIETTNKLVEPIPHFFEQTIEAGFDLMGDAIKFIKDSVSGDDEQEEDFEGAETEEIPRTSNNLNEQRYVMLLKRFNI